METTTCGHEYNIVNAPHVLGLSFPLLQILFDGRVTFHKVLTAHYVSLNIETMLFNIWYNNSKGFTQEPPYGGSDRLSGDHVADPHEVTAHGQENNRDNLVDFKNLSITLVYKALRLRQETTLPLWLWHEDVVDTKPPYPAN